MHEWHVGECPTKKDKHLIAYMTSGSYFCIMESALEINGMMRKFKGQKESGQPLFKFKVNAHSILVHLL